jgi:hypothetical protein
MYIYICTSVQGCLNGGGQIKPKKAGPAEVRKAQGMGVRREGEGSGEAIRTLNLEP